MSQTKKVTVGGVSAIVLGVALALMLPERESQAESAVPDKKPAATREQRHARMADPTQVEEDTAAADYLDQRWGHMGDSGVVTAHVDPLGNRYFVEKKIFVGRGRGGQKIYARAYAKPERLHPKAIKVGNHESMLGARVTLENWEPGPMSKLYRNVKHAENPEDLPPEIQKEHPKHPDYKGLLGNG